MYGLGAQDNTSTTTRSRTRSTATCRASPDDVFTWFAGYRMQFFAAKGLATPIDDVWKALTPFRCRSSQGRLDRRRRHQYLVPINNYPWAVFYRKSVWKRQGLHRPDDVGPVHRPGQEDEGRRPHPIAFTDKDGWPAMGTFDILNMRINGYQFHVDLMAGKESWDGPQVKAVFSTGPSCSRTTRRAPSASRGRKARRS
jgi:multiple sugar transport system substrate-binding protein